MSHPNAPASAAPFILRGIGAFFVVLGAAVCTNPLFLFLGWVGLALVMGHAGIFRIHMRLTLAFIFPVALGSMLIHGVANVADTGGIWWTRFAIVAPKALLIAERLSVIAAAGQLCLLPLTTDGRLIPFLRAWRLPSRGVLVFSATITLLAEVSTRGRQLIEARRAQGRGFGGRWGTFAQLPLVLMPLVVNVLDSAAVRAELWHSRNLIERLEQYEPVVEPASRLMAVSAVVLSILWAFAALRTR